jgi:hypothetical protein
MSWGFDDHYISNTTDVSQSNGLVQWVVNGMPMAIDLDHPTLQHVAEGGNMSFASNRHVFEVDGKHAVSLLIASTFLIIMTNNLYSGSIG